MILPFSTKINGKANYFVEKIHKGITENFMLSPINPEIHYTSDYNFVAKSKLSAKYHTIRTDKRDFWRIGRKIDFFINCRQKNMFRFAPVLRVVSTQKIEIKWHVTENKKPYWYKNATISVDDFYLNAEQVIKLSVNDGFDSVEDFFKYFDKDFIGKIIHWTDLKY